MTAPKSIARRGTLLGVAAAFVAATIFPAASVFADALNPLTERSLLLSSSAPGFVDTDGSGNSFASPNSIGENYAPAGSGPNGKKTGETFSFRVSSDATVKGYTLQYCTTAAGLCQAPGNNTGNADPDQDGDTSDSTRLANETPTTGGWAIGKSDLNVLAGFTQDTAATSPTNIAPGSFQIFVDGAATAGSDWTFSVDNWEDPEYILPVGEGLTGKNNLITLTSATGDALTQSDKVEIVFQPSETVFITNPGAGAFFVKLNTYSTNAGGTHLPTTDANIIDGGVTVANVMTDSIHITTKVLETMAFSVGTRNRDTVVVNCTPANVTTGCEGTGSVHGPCDPVQNINNNRLNLGNPSAEYSLETARAWDVYSYWRLSSNSSGGATVYYSGDTLANTVGDEIAEAGATKAINTPGMEQFGLGFVDAGDDTMAADFSGSDPRSFPFRTLIGQTTGDYDLGSLPAQPISTNYNEGAGTLGTGGAAGTAKIAFQKSSLTVPVPIAQQNDQVISCSTAKMRYIANIAADTPAGVYTTKINYLAAPQY